MQEVLLVECKSGAGGLVKFVMFILPQQQETLGSSLLGLFNSGFFDNRSRLGGEAHLQLHVNSKHNPA